MVMVQSYLFQNPHQDESATDCSCGGFPSARAPEHRALWGSAHELTAYRMQ
jgi:hypothetical protein